VDPATAPMLHAAWHPFITGRPSARSTSTASAFIATSSVPWTAPATSSVATSHANPRVTPSPVSTTGSATTVTRTRAVLPRRAASRPVSCIATTAATPKAADTSPSRPSLSPCSSLSDGVRTTIPAIDAPFAANTAVTAHRAT
jgi:hypothetical protein